MSFTNSLLSINLINRSSYLNQSYMPIFLQPTIVPEWLKSSKLGTFSSWVYWCCCPATWSGQNLMSKFFQSDYQKLVR